MAIKVINIGCEAVAVREVRFMRFLGSVPNAEFCPGNVRVCPCTSSDLTGRACCLTSKLFWFGLEGADKKTVFLGGLVC